MIHGTWDPRFEQVVHVFASSLSRRAEAGAGLSLLWGGESVIDVWGGTADRRSGRPWDRSTWCPVFSCTKAITATVVLDLADRGDLDLDRSITAFWPEWAGGGRDSITAAMLLSHTAGLPSLDVPLTIGEANDGVRVAALLATQRPRWAPGRAHGYHALTYGWLLGELVRRSTGDTVGGHAARIAQHLGAEFCIGASPAVFARTAFLVDPLATASAASGRPGPATDLQKALRRPGSLSAAALLNPPLLHRAHRANRADVMAAEWPAVNGLATANGLARLMAAVASGDLLSTGIRRRATSTHARGLDRVLLHDTAFGLGYMLPCELIGAGRPGAFGHTGAGGSLCLADPARGFGLGYVTSLWGADPLLDPRGGRIVDAVYEAVDGAVARRA